MSPNVWIWPFVGLMSLGIFLAAGAAARRGPAAPRVHLAVLLLAAAAYAGEFAAMFSGFYASPVVFFTYPLFFLLGPAAAGCLRALDGTLPPLRRQLWHVLPAAIFVADLAPYYADAIRAGGSPPGGGRTILGLDGYAQCVIQLAHTAAYLLASRPALRRIEARARDLHSGDAVDRAHWVRRLFAALAVAVILGIAAMLFLRLSGTHVLVAEALMGLSVSGLIVGLGWSLLQRPGVLDAPPAEARPPAASPRPDLAETATRVAAVVEEHRLWLRPDLTLGALAEAADLPRHQVSEALNRGLGQSFFDFINAYRVHEAAAQLLNPRDSGKTMLAIAYDSGFASKASFNRVFKERAGRTPSQFRKDGTLEELGRRLPTGSASRPATSPDPVSSPG